MTPFAKYWGHPPRIDAPA